MYRNEKGFTLAEGLVSFGAILFIATILFPLMFQMIIKLDGSKENLMAYRLLYETTEQVMTSDTFSSNVSTVKGKVYKTNVFTSGGKWKVCVFYENKQNCITEIEE